MLRKYNITAFPRGSLISFALHAATSLSQFPDFASFHPLGRAALYWAFRSLGSEHGAVAWFPPYHCGVEVQAGIEAGFEPRFYRLHANLCVNETDLISRVEKDPGPIVLPHYFGFPQPAVARLASLCEDQGWILIEDCAHALFSRHEQRGLGDYADMAFYSFRKTLPTFEGAALKISAQDLRAKYQPVLTARSVSVYGRFLRAKIAQLIGNSGAARLRTMLGAIERDPGLLIPESLEFGDWRDQSISPVSKHLLELENAAEIVRRRRENYENLDALLRKYEGYQKLFHTLPTGVCPLCLPMRVSGRAELLRQLYQCGICPYIFGAYPHPKLTADLLAETEWMRDSIVTLPVHQELTETEVLQVAEAVGPLLQRHSPENESLSAKHSAPH